MKQKEEIIDIIENQLGIKNEEDFDAYYQIRVGDSRQSITLDEIELLSPDNIDNKAFWEYLDEKFPRSICNVQWSENPTPDQINNLNMRLALSCGVLNTFFAADYTIPSYHHGYGCGHRVLEIGPGHGAIANIIKNKSFCNYESTDIVPRFPGVVQSEQYGLPEELKRKQYNTVVSCNVFQHLSIKQRNAYYRDIYDCLEDLGHFSIAMSTNEFSKRPQRCFCEENGRDYICHYGQYTELQNMNEIITDLANHTFFFTGEHIRRNDGFCMIECTKDVKSQKLREEYYNKKRENNNV